MNSMIATIELNWPFRNVIVVVGIALLVTILIHSVFAAVTSKKQRNARRGWIAALVYFAFAILVIGLTATSFGAILVEGVMQNWALLAHISIAGAFVFVMLVFAIIWNPNYLAQTGSGAIPVEASKKDRWWLFTWSLWGVLFSSVVVAGSMLLQMLPVLDTEGMLEVTELHRYSGLVLSASLILNVYSIAIRRIGWR